MAETFEQLLRVYATKTCTHSNTIKARAERGAMIRFGKIENRMAANLHTASLLLREAADRLDAQKAPAEAQPVVHGLTNDQIIATCEAAGLKWMEPDDLLPDGTVDLDGFPGGFDIAEMADMRKLFAALTGQQGGSPLYAAPPQVSGLPEGMLDRIKAAEQRIVAGHSPRRIPADPTDADLVLAEVRAWIEGRPAPFWVRPKPEVGS